MKLNIYKDLKFEGKPVQYETDTHNVYDKQGFFLFVGCLDGKKLTRAAIIKNDQGKAVEQIVKEEPAKEEAKEEKK